MAPFTAAATITSAAISLQDLPRDVLLCIFDQLPEPYDVPLALTSKTLFRACVGFRVGGALPKDALVPSTTRFVDVGTANVHRSHANSWRLQSHPRLGRVLEKRASDFTARGDFALVLRHELPWIKRRVLMLCLRSWMPQGLRLCHCGLVFVRDDELEAEACTRCWHQRRNTDLPLPDFVVTTRCFLGEAHNGVGIVLKTFKKGWYARKGLEFPDSVWEPYHRCRWEGHRAWVSAEHLKVDVELVTGEEPFDLLVDRASQGESEGEEEHETWDSEDADDSSDGEEEWSSDSEDEDNKEEGMPELTSLRLDD
jgi:hypothetical protein